MFPKTILFPLEVSESDAGVTRAAEFCLASDAHLTLLLVATAPSPPMVVDSVSFADIWAEEGQRAQQSLRDRRDSLQALLQKLGTSSDIRTDYCPLDLTESAIGLHARYCDLVYMARQPGHLSGLAGRMIAGALFEAARPVLITGTGKAAALQGQDILVAWDGHVPSVRAVTAALPILKAAKSVCMLCIDPDTAFTGTGEAPGWDLATWISRHGVKIEVTTLPAEGRYVPEIIEQHARELGSGLIVAGAFGHSRLRQRLFGGTTTTLVKDCAIPLFLAH